MDKKQLGSDEKKFVYHVSQDYEDELVEEEECYKEENPLPPSKDFLDGMNAMLKHPETWGSYMKEDTRKSRAYRTRSALRFTAAAVLFLLAAVKYVGPMKTSASIPDFIIRDIGDGSKRVEVLPNPYMLSGDLEGADLPELRLGYVPEGFGLEETPELSESIVKYVSKAQEAVFYASIMPYDRQKYMYLCADDAEQIVVGGRERIKSKQTDDMAIYLYAWKEGEYLLYLYTYEVEEGEAERILEAFSFQETGN